MQIDDAFDMCVFSMSNGREPCPVLSRMIASCWDRNKMLAYCGDEQIVSAIIRTRLEWCPATITVDVDGTEYLVEYHDTSRTRILFGVDVQIAGDASTRQTIGRHHVKPSLDHAVKMVAKYLESSRKGSK